MANNDGAITTSEILVSDGSIDKVINDVERAIDTLMSLRDAVHTVAGKVRHDMERMSGATSEGREYFGMLVEEAERLKRGYTGLNAGIDKMQGMVDRLTMAWTKNGQMTKDQVKFLEQVNAKIGVFRENLAEVAGEIYETDDEGNKMMRKLGDMGIETMRELTGSIAGVQNEVNDAVTSLTPLLGILDKIGKATAKDNAVYAEYEKQLAAIVEKEKERMAVGDQKSRRMTRAEERFGEAGSMDSMAATEMNLFSAKIEERQKAEAQYINATKGSLEEMRAELKLELIDIAELDKDSQAFLDKAENIKRLMSEIKTAESAYTGKAVSTVDAAPDSLFGMEQRLKAAYDEFGRMSHGSIEAKDKIEEIRQLEAAIKSVKEELKGVKMPDFNLPTQVDINSSLDTIRTRLREINEEYSKMNKQERESARGASLRQEGIDLKLRETEINAVIQAEERLNAAERIKVQLEAQLQASGHAKAVTYQELALQAEYYQAVLETLNPKNEDERMRIDEVTASLQENRKEMVKMQSTMGMSVRTADAYGRTWNGLRYQVGQVVREMPSMAISANTFFLAISNNIPMLVDEIKLLQEKNKDLQRDGEDTVSVFKEVLTSLWSFNTLIVVILSLLSYYGEDVKRWVKSLWSGVSELKTIGEAWASVAENVEDAGKSYAKQVYNIAHLSALWKKEVTNSGKLNFLKKFREELDSTGLSIKTISQAEEILVKNTKEVINSFANMTLSKAAENLATEEFTKLISTQATAVSEMIKGGLEIKVVDENGQEILRPLDPGDIQLLKEYYDKYRKDISEYEEVASGTGYGSSFNTRSRRKSERKIITETVQRMLDEGVVKGMKAANMFGRNGLSGLFVDLFNADDYFANAQMYTELGISMAEKRDAMLKKYGIERNTKKQGGTGQPSDLTHQQNAMKTWAEDANADAKNANMLNEADKKRAKALDDLNKKRNEARTKLADIAKLEEKIRKGEGEVKDKTPQQALNELASNRKDIMESLEEYKKQELKIENDYNLDILTAKQKADKDIFNAEKHNATAIKEFELKQDKERFELMIALAKEKGDTFGKEVLEGAKRAIVIINRQLKELDIDKRLAELKRANEVLKMAMTTGYLPGYKDKNLLHPSLSSYEQGYERNKSENLQALMAFEKEYNPVREKRNNLLEEEKRLQEELTVLMKKRTMVGNEEDNFNNILETGVEAWDKDVTDKREIFTKAINKIQNRLFSLRKELIPVNSQFEVLTNHFYTLLEDVGMDMGSDLTTAFKEQIKEFYKSILIAPKDLQKNLAIELQTIENAREQALLENKSEKVAVEDRKDEAVINLYYDKQRMLKQGEYALKIHEQEQNYAKSEFDTRIQNAFSIAEFELEQEEKTINKKLELFKQGLIEMTNEEANALRNRLILIEREKQKHNLMGAIAQHGVLGGLMMNTYKKKKVTNTETGETSTIESPVFSDESIDAAKTWAEETVNYIQEVIQAYADLAAAAVSAAEKQVSAAQSALDAEMEARANGYANNVAAARAELQLQKANLAEKKRMQESAAKTQEAVNSVTQASSLVTSAAQIFQAFSGIPIVGVPLAIAMIGTMFGAFTFAKIQAAQAAKASQQYGEGGLEFLEGGSHASGNDIDLGISNRRGKRMRAEGGEAMAVINKRNTRRYRKILPQIVDSLNKGTFESKYLRAFDGNDGLLMSVNSNSQVDLSKVEEGLQVLQKQNETKYTPLPDGNLIMKYKNVTRYIRRA